MENFKDEKFYISEDISEYTEWKWYKRKGKYNKGIVPKIGQYLINDDGIKYDIKNVVIYTNEFTMIQDYGKEYGEKSSIDETDYDECFWNRLSDEPSCHITFLICCNKSKQ
jgi:hypothetical protein